MANSNKTASEFSASNGGNSPSETHQQQRDQSPGRQQEQQQQQGPTSNRSMNEIYAGIREKYNLREDEEIAPVFLDLEFFDI